MPLNDSENQLSHQSLTCTKKCDLHTDLDAIWQFNSLNHEPKSPTSFVSHQIGGLDRRSCHDAHPTATAVDWVWQQWPLDQRATRQIHLIPPLKWSNCGLSRWTACSRSPSQNAPGRGRVGPIQELWNWLMISNRFVCSATSDRRVVPNVWPAGMMRAPRHPQRGRLTLIGFKGETLELGWWCCYLLGERRAKWWLRTEISFSDCGIWTCTMLVAVSSVMGDLMDHCWWVRCRINEMFNFFWHDYFKMTSIEFRGHLEIMDTLGCI